MFFYLAKGTGIMATRKVVSNLFNVALHIYINYTIAQFIHYADCI